MKGERETGKTNTHTNTEPYNKKDINNSNISDKVNLSIFSFHPCGLHPDSLVDCNLFLSYLQKL